MLLLQEMINNVVLNVYFHSFVIFRLNLCLLLWKSKWRRVKILRNQHFVIWSHGAILNKIKPLILILWLGFWSKKKVFFLVRIKCIFLFCIFGCYWNLPIWVLAPWIKFERCFEFNLGVHWSYLMRWVMYVTRVWDNENCLDHWVFTQLVPLACTF